MSRYIIFSGIYWWPQHFTDATDVSPTPLVIGVIPLSSFKNPLARLWYQPSHLALGHPTHRSSSAPKPFRLCYLWPHIQDLLRQGIPECRTMQWRAHYAGAQVNNYVRVIWTKDKYGSRKPLQSEAILVCKCCWYSHLERIWMDISLLE